jgi:hypothetical protein
MLQFLDANKEWLFSGLGVSALGGLWLLMQRKRGAEASDNITQTQRGGDNSTNIQVGRGSVTGQEGPER